MPIVINSFEAVAEGPEQQTQNQENNGSNKQSSVPKPQDLVQVLHILAEQSLRSWAH